MKQPTINYNGDVFSVLSISWFERSGELSHVHFKDEDDKYHTAFNKVDWEVEGYGEDGILHLDLEKALAHNEATT